MSDQIKIENIGEVGDYDDDLENKFQVSIDAEATLLLQRADEQRANRKAGNSCNAINNYFAKLGGAAGTGAAKRRGDSEYYKRLSAKAAEKRRKQKEDQ